MKACWYRIFLALACLGLLSCNRAAAPPNSGPVVIQYWEKWTGFEAEAMKKIVEKFNASQSRARVNYFSITQIDQKLLLATAGGNPPDIAGLYDSNIVTYAEKGALLPLDSRMKRDGVQIDSYLPSIASICRHQGFTWGLPAAPSDLALHYNKRLFREAGLDPERPPRTIAELDDYARKLTRYDAQGNITQMGFSPADPGWWNPIWGIWFGASLWDGSKTITCASPESLRAFEWLASYPKNYGLARMQSFQAGGGQFASTQNLFISGKLAMQLQGVYMFNYIDKYGKELEWGAAPFPSDSENLKDVTLVQCDVLVIPKGARHPELAWEFIKFLQRQDNMEELALAQKKFSPLKATSEAFYQTHPNPCIRLFRRLAESPNAQVWPRLGIQNEYIDEIGVAFDEIFLGRKTPQEALGLVRERIQPKLDRMNLQWERIRQQRLKEWSEQ